MFDGMPIDAEKLAREGRAVSVNVPHPAYPEAQALVAADIAEKGDMDRGFFIAKVPNVPVYVLYGVDDASHTIRVVMFRTYEGVVN